MERIFEVNQEVYYAQKMGQTGQSNETTEIGKYKIENLSPGQSGNMIMTRLVSPAARVFAQKDEVFTEDEFEEVLQGVNPAFKPGSLEILKSHEPLLNAISEAVAARRAQEVA